MSIRRTHAYICAYIYTRTFMYACMHTQIATYVVRKKIVQVIFSYNNN